jgi:hypothetical protein
VPEIPESIGLPIAAAIGALLIGWYFAGNEVMRRRSHRLAIWCKRVIDPLGGTQKILWISGQAFRLEVDGPKAPFRSVLLTGLVESWDVPVVWAWNRFHGRRDVILLQASLRELPLWGFEVYRPGTLLAGDARNFARSEGWPEAPLESASDLIAAAAGDPPRHLAADLVAALNAERGRLIRLAVRRQGHHLTLALNVPDPQRFDPQAASDVLQRLAQRLSAAS